MKYIFLIAILTIVFAALLPSRTADSKTSSMDAQNAAELYSKNCATCHGKDGHAKTLKGKLKHARDLTDATWQDRVSDERLFNSIMNGKGKMPAFGKKISEQEADSLVAYVRGLKK
ncbi:MAG TPA: hypothetical protein DHU55_18500 [Blastocatellia bacterium]|jgi:mono/diheme cytochrome c family protein|nr:hypothetical protein [Blastocatellia bacterium]HAF21998.1 hypothetical protein [Blastocatellia bacterium]HCX31736.1 hypothetical protein [Blastocatellia bacterium]